MECYKVKAINQEEAYFSNKKRKEKKKKYMFLCVDWIHRVIL